MLQHIGSIVAGETCTHSGRTTEAVINPADESTIAQLHLASTADIDQTIHSTQRGFKAWSATPLVQRQAILKDTANWLLDHIDEIAADLCAEQGKSLPQAANEVQRSAAAINWYADAADQIKPLELPVTADGSHPCLLPHPCGPVLAMTPWNFPLWLAVRKIAPALAMGCSVIYKGAEETPMTAVWLTRAFHESGVPSDVLNLLLGVPAQISSTVINSGVIGHVTFTGSVPVGKLLARQCGEMMIPGTWELGGHSAAIITADVDIPAVIQQLAGFKFRNSGQICVSPNRFYVEAPIYDEFVQQFAAFAQSLKIGAGTQPDTGIGPLANARRLEAMNTLVTDAIDKGAELICGGKREGDRGYFFQPTVLGNVPDDAQIMFEEPFGPVAPMVSFKNLNEAILKANTLPYGLAAYIFTNDADKKQKLEHALEAGFIQSNTIGAATDDLPWCGMKDSGYGYEGGIAGLENFVHKKLVMRNE